MKSNKINVLKKDFGVMIHFLKLAHRIDKIYIPLLICSGIVKALTLFINIIMPKYIIDELLGEKRIEVFIILVAIIILGNRALNLLNKFIVTILDTKNFALFHGFELIMGKKVMEIDFEKVEDPEVLDLKETAMQPIKQQGAIWRMVNGIVNSISHIITVIGLTGIICTMNPLIIVFILIIVIINFLLTKKVQIVQYEFYQKLIPINRHAEYYYGLSGDFSIGKDIRIYNLDKLIMKKIRGFNDESISYFEDTFNKMGSYGGVSRIFIELQSLAVYGYIAYKVIKKAITVGEFTLYTSAAMKFGSSIGELFKIYAELTQMCRYLDHFMKMESIEISKSRISKEGTPKENHHNKVINNIIYEEMSWDSKEKEKKFYTIEFKNVYFKYPRANEYTLRDINITIENGEKLSVVGLNGAGKTTFIKLLCRLYEPTEGEILLNGVNILEYDYEEYMKLLSVVFQDFKLLAFTIKENIGLSQWEAAADKEIEEVIEKAGFGEDLKKLNKGIYTSIYKVFDKEGIEFSGGQSQKLAIARAIYKNAPIVILDEPTAALDPFAEFEIYSKFNELVGHKTAIYISHRLSSCKFCDSIAVFNDGKIVEYGTHENLVKGNGLYKEMYTAQAQYYV